MRNDDEPQVPATLGLGSSLLRPAHTAALLAAIVGLPVAVLAALLLAIHGEALRGPDRREALAAAWEKLAQEAGAEPLVWALAVLLPVAVVLLLGQRLARIRVTDAGLEADIPRWLGLGLFRQTAGRWQTLWDEVRRVRLVTPAAARNPAQRLGAYRLVLERERGDIWLSPFTWFDRAGPDHRLRLGELFAAAGMEPERRLRDAPLLRMVEARGLVIESTPAGEPAAAQPTRFDLARHAGMLTQLALMFAAGLYALGDAFFVAAWRPLAPLPVTPFVATALAAALGAALLGRGAPRTERLVVGALMVAALVAAVHPALLRFNAATAVAEVHTYRATAPGRFEAVEAGLPPLDLRDEDVAEYWTQFPPGAIHEFTLLRGNAGFHQLELAPLYERTRAFYRGLRETS